MDTQNKIAPLHACMKATGATAKECEECRQPFTPTKPWQAFCSGACRDQHHNRKRRTNPKNDEARRQPGIEVKAETRTSAPKHSDTPRPLQLRPGSKIASVIATLTERSLNRFEAERVCHDHALNSTVAEIQRYGIRVDRVFETVPGFNGKPTRCARYHISADQREHAWRLLGIKP